LAFAGPLPEPPPSLARGAAPRSAWVEVDMACLGRNFALIRRQLPPQVRLLSVVKDDAYGHGALPVARAAVAAGANFLAVSTIEEAVTLRESGIQARILMLGDRHESEFPWCLDHDLTCCVSEPEGIQKLGSLAQRYGRLVPVHLKVNTGMNRYGAPWSRASEAAELVRAHPALRLEGVLSHFAQSDGPNKAWADVQLDRFEFALKQMANAGLPVSLRHMANTGAFLEIPAAHFDMVRLGILPLGVYPSAECRRLAGIEPVMTVKARIASVQQLKHGEAVGYGMRFKASRPTRLGVLPIGYGDGYPYSQHQGSVLIHGRRAPVVGATAMDAITVDLTDIPEAKLWDEAVVMGKQGKEQISAQNIADLNGSIPYQLLTAWRTRLPQTYLHAAPGG
jgi:alanine racemase